MPKCSKCGRYYFNDASNHDNKLANTLGKCIYCFNAETEELKRDKDNSFIANPPME